MDFDWDLFSKLFTTIFTTVFTIIGGLFAYWKYRVDRRERILTSDFEKIYKLLCNYKFKKDMDENHLLRTIYYKNISYFNGIKNEVIDVVIKTQNRKINFNNDFYKINKFFQKNLLIINNNQDGFFC